MVSILEVCGGLCNPSYRDGGILGWLVNREPPKGSKWPAEGPHYTWPSEVLRNICSVPGREAKSLMGYPFPSFRKGSIQTQQ